MENNIKHKILKTAELTLEEKKTLVYEFWKSDLEYSKCMYEWKNALLREIYSYDTLGELDKNYIYSYKYADYSYLIRDNDVTNMVWQEVRFLNFMENVRPMVSLEEITGKKRFTLKKNK